MAIKKSILLLSTIIVLSSCTVTGYQSYSSVDDQSSSSQSSSAFPIDSNTKYNDLINELAKGNFVWSYANSSGKMEYEFDIDNNLFKAVAYNYNNSSSSYVEFGQVYRFIKDNKCYNVGVEIENGQYVIGEPDTKDFWGSWVSNLSDFPNKEDIKSNTFPTSILNYPWAMVHDYLASDSSGRIAINSSSQDSPTLKIANNEIEVTYLEGDHNAVQVIKNIGAVTIEVPQYVLEAIKDR